MIFESRLIYFSPPENPGPSSSADNTSPSLSDRIAAVPTDLDPRYFERPSIGADIVDTVIPILQRRIIVRNRTTNEYADGVTLTASTLKNLPDRASGLNIRNLLNTIYEVSIYCNFRFSDEQILEIQGEPLKRFLIFVCQEFYNIQSTNLPSNLSSELSLADIQNWQMRQGREDDLTVPDFLKIDLLSQDSEFSITKYYKGFLALKAWITNNKESMSSGWQVEHEKLLNNVRSNRDSDLAYFVLRYFVSGGVSVIDDYVPNLTDDKFREIDRIDSDVVESIRGLEDVKFLHTGLISDASDVLAFSDESRGFRSFISNVESSNKPAQNRDRDLSALHEHFRSHLSPDSYNRDIDDLAALESDITNAENTHVLARILNDLLDASANMYGLNSRLMFGLTLEQARELAMVIYRKHPDRPEEQIRATIEQNSSSSGLQIQKLISIAPTLLVANNTKRVYDYLAYPDPANNPMVSNVSLRLEVFQQLAKEIYVDDGFRRTDFGKSLMTMVEQADDSTDPNNPFVASMIEYLGDVESRLSAYNSLNRPSAVGMPISALNTLMGFIDNVSEQNILVASAAVMVATNQMLKLPGMGVALTALGTTVALPLLLKDSSLVEISSVFHRQSLSSVISETFYTQLNFVTTEKENFPYFLRSLLTLPDFTCHSWGDFEDFVNGRSQQLIDGDSSLQKMLRGLTPEDPLYENFHSCLRKLFNRIQTLEGMSTDRDANLLDTLLHWISIDPQLREMASNLRVDLTDTLNNTPRAGFEATPETLPAYLRNIRNHLRNHLHTGIRDVSDFSDEQLFKHFNFTLRDSALTLQNVSPMYGAMFQRALSNFTFDTSDNSLSRSPLNHQTDAVGNMYYSFQFASNFNDANRFEINKACVERIQEHHRGADIQISFNVVTGDESGIVGITVMPTGTVSEQLSRLTGSPINQDTLAGSFVTSANMQAYTPIIRILDSLVPGQSEREERTSAVLFTDPIDTVIGKVRGAFSRVSNFSDELSRFWSAYTSNSLENESLHGKITGALMNYIQNGPGGDESKRQRLRSLSSYSGLELYYQILNSTLTASGDGAASVETIRAFGLLKRLDDVSDNFFSNHPGVPRELIESKVRYLKVLLSLAIKSVNSDLSRNIFRSLGLFQLVNPDGAPVNVDEVIQNFFRHQLSVAAGIEHTPFLTGLPEQTFDDNNADTAWNAYQNTIMSFSEVTGLHSVVVQSGSKIEVNNPPDTADLSTLERLGVESGGRVTRTIEIPANLIQNCTVRGRLRLKRKGNQPHTRGYEHLQHGRILTTTNNHRIYLPDNFDESRAYKILYLPSVENTSGFNYQSLVQRLNRGTSKNIAVVYMDGDSSDLSANRPNPAQIRAALVSHFSATDIASQEVIAYQNDAFSSRIENVRLIANTNSSNNDHATDDDALYGKL